MKRLSIVSCCFILAFLLNSVVASATPFDVLSQSYSANGFYSNEYGTGSFNVSSISPIGHIQISNSEDIAYATVDSGYGGYGSLFLEVDTGSSFAARTTAFGSIEFRPRYACIMDFRLTESNATEAGTSMGLDINNVNAVLYQDNYHFFDNINNVSFYQFGGLDYSVQLIADPSKTYTLYSNAWSNNDGVGSRIEVNIVPEPTSMLLLGLGLAGLAGLRKMFIRDLC